MFLPPQGHHDSYDCRKTRPRVKAAGSGDTSCLLLCRCRHKILASYLLWAVLPFLFIATLYSQDTYDRYPNVDKSVSLNSHDMRIYQTLN